MEAEKDDNQLHEESPVNTKNLDGALSDDHSSKDASPSSLEATGLLSLPWEMVTHIASHLPAQCVITVLPKVCHALSNVGKDNTAWQIRARRLTGSRANFPVGPKEDFDWPTACLEMEQLIAFWTDQAHIVAKQSEDQVNERKRQDEEQGAALPEGGEVEGVEGVGVAGQEVAYGVDEGLEVALEGANEEMPENQLEEAAALMNEERNLGQEDDLNHQENIDPRLLGNERLLESETKPARSPSPSPALECLTLPSDHIAQINSVLLVGGEGKFCATGSRDWNVQLWDLEAGPSGALLHTLGAQGHFSSHKGWVWCLASQGPLLASGGFDSTVRLWDLPSGGGERGTIKADAPVLCLSFQDNILLAGTFDRKVTMYDPRVAEPLVKSLHLHGNAVMCLAADDRYIISGSKDCTVAVYDCRAGKGLKKIRLKTYPLSMSYSGNEVWAGDNKGMLHAFSMQAGTLQTLSQFDVGHTAMVTGIHRSPGSLYTCSADRTVKVHIPCSPPRTLCTLQQQTGVNGLSVEAGVLAVASGETCIEVWRPRK
ncbi:F-box/WD repeat-containing protein 9 [Boleophthalmus pectinirostris]|uniref:F-box/WD repeat-containing protein 9 n=1 Tax=Boleophthalmus pectinirostris TaxID=150288 RepID=UPI000A1C42E1|nr:F-box/WD repeat-containing protein 9 [Boleophthalmus pectinirostris]XP_020793824.1 F-box/WD repeat-containing protein 9 [Boleophthalmus pectinirostris]XP_020793832.1 F-box/WD repeat-containing protein 9 [Boleophthalmus pectinirostris]XP_055008525.1 F-box/WD repeat-containing protein 9 [Boleophthalmus pectinirostris]